MNNRPFNEMKFFFLPLFLAGMKPLTHRVQTTCTFSTRRRYNTIKPDTIITPTELVTHGKTLDFALGKASNLRDIYVYSMKVCPHQQDFTISDKVAQSSNHIPPRIMQNVHGYFNLRADHPTRLNLSASWDSTTVSSTKVFTDTNKFPKLISSGLYVAISFWFCPFWIILSEWISQVYCTFQYIPKVQGPVLFYIVDGETGVPRPLAESERLSLFEPSTPATLPISVENLPAEPEELLFPTSPDVIQYLYLSFNWAMIS